MKTHRHPLLPVLFPLAMWIPPIAIPIPIPIPISTFNPSPFSLPSSDSPSPDFASFKLVWVPGGLPGSKSQIRLLRLSDHIIYTATPRKICGHRAHQIFSPVSTVAEATLEVHTKGKQFTLTVPIVGAKSNLVSETVGICVDGAGVRLLLYSGNTPYVPPRKADRLSAIALRGETVTNGFLYRWKMPELGVDGKPKPFAEIPEIAQKSRKNVVLLDSQGEIVLKMYKFGEQIIHGAAYIKQCEIEKGFAKEIEWKEMIESPKRVLPIISDSNCGRI
jgi:hypothetical protein